MTVYLEKISILIACHHRLVREAIRDMLESQPNLRVTGQVEHFADVPGFIELRRPEAVVLDLQMPPVTPGTIKKELSGISRLTRLVVISAFNIPEYNRQLIDCGIAGLVTKDSSSDALVTAVKDGKPYNPFICEEARVNLGAPFSERSVLTARQKEVVRLVTEGYSSKEIAKRIFVAEKTVEIHRYNILKKLNLSNTVSLVNYVSMYGI